MSVHRNHLNYRVGESHPKAELTDVQVRDMRARYARWKAAGLRKGYGTLAYLFRCSEWTARDIVTYRTRASA